jgi:predicted oxidoreductase (fatty acid repression mutant protein)
MKRDFKEALKLRRSYYAITSSSPIPDKEIEDIVKFASDNVPSAYNSQSTRMVLLMGEHHQIVWSIVKETLRKMIDPAAFEETEKKINQSFASGYGTILFLEDGGVIEKLQEENPLYKEKFADWSQHTAGMHQLAVWVMLEDAGFGASLQHYNPIIDEAVRARWNLPAAWRLIAQMPFGEPLEHPQKKPMKPIEERVKVFR